MHVVPSTGQKPAVLRAAHVVARKAALAKQKFSTLTNRRLSKQALRWDVTGGRARPKGVGCPSPSGGLSSGLCPSTPSEPGNECGFSFIPKVLKLVLTGGDYLGRGLRSWNFTMPRESWARSNS